MTSKTPKGYTVELLSPPQISIVVIFDVTVFDVRLSLSPPPSCHRDTSVILKGSVCVRRCYVMNVEAGSSFSSISSPMFDGDNYQEAVEEDYEILVLPNNPTKAQIKLQKEKNTKKSKAKACLSATVSSTVFTRIITLKSAYDIWNYLKSEYEGDERIKGMCVLNLIREFELQKMKETESMKEYSDRLLDVANRIRLLGSEFEDSRIVEKNSCNSAWKI
ncbi:uncharacterized protein [Gossypium hirsutum]|uniref:Uncharacterized protein n=1 Tax=Gossypium hirsutum TaxID=3635 RepID=A0A1U8JMC3_GOSHI|nr:uncharacterized protein LOC107908699 [Gossypium hirsutum]